MDIVQLEFIQAWSNLLKAMSHNFLVYLILEKYSLKKRVAFHNLYVFSLWAMKHSFCELAMKIHTVGTFLSWSNVKK